MAETVVIGDDLTGANATGALYAHNGLRAVTVSTLAAAERIIDDVDVLVVTTESRHLPASEAAQRVREVVETLSGRVRLMVKRVDTTLRGNLGAESEALLVTAREQSGSRRVCGLVVPAFPTAGRTTVGGIQFLDGVPVERTWAGRDPFTPVHHSRVSTVLAEQTQLTIAEIDVDRLMQGVDSLAQDLEDASRQADFVVVDSIAVSDQRIIAQAAAQAASVGDLSWVVVDSGPFGAHMARALGIGSSHRGLSSPVLAIVGSLTDQTREQVDELISQHGAKFVTVSDTKKAALEIVEQLAEFAADGAAVVGVRAERDDTETVSPETASCMLTLLRQVAASAVDRIRPVGVYASGGDVATGTIAALGGDGFQIESEVLPLAVVGSVVGGSHGGLGFATKGGLVGGPDAAILCVEALQTRARTHVPTILASTQA